VGHVTVSGRENLRKKVVGKTILSFLEMAIGEKNHKWHVMFRKGEERGGGGMGYRSQGKTFSRKGKSIGEKRHSIF